MPLDGVLSPCGAVAACLALFPVLASSALAATAAPRGANGAAFVSQTPPPARMDAGQQVTVSITMRHTGRSAWTAAGGYKLGSQSPTDNSTWRVGRVPLGAGGQVTAGGSKTFAFTITAPQKPGAYAFQWRMVQERSNVVVVDFPADPGRAFKF